MKVYITRKIPQKAIDFLKGKGFSVSVFKDDRPIPRKELIKNIKNVDAVIPLLTDKIDKEVIDEMKKCRVIANYAVGYDNIDTGYAKTKNIIARIIFFRKDFFDFLIVKQYKQSIKILLEK